MFASTPPPPYTAVIFTSMLADDHGYTETAARMAELAAEQPGFLGVESARGDDGLGITVSYWSGPDQARAWKQVAEHLEAQRLGRHRFYSGYRVRIATVERDYGLDPSPGSGALD